MPSCDDVTLAPDGRRGAGLLDDGNTTFDMLEEGLDGMKIATLSELIDVDAKFGGRADDFMAIVTMVCDD